MSQPIPSMATTGSAVQSSTADGRLRGHWLALARTIWLLLAAGLLVNFILGIQAYYAQLQTVCTLGAADCGFSWLPTPANVQALHQVGLSLDVYATAFTSFAVAISLIFLVVGALIFWRKSDEWLGLLISLLLVLFGCFGFTNVLQDAVPPAAFTPFQAFITLIQFPQYIGLGVFLLTFPSGRFAPRWTWTLALLWVAQDIAFSFPAPYGFANWPGWLEGADILVVWGSTAAAQVYRYRRIYTPIQRQQTKWVVFGLATGFLVVALSSILGGVVPSLSALDSPYQLLNGVFVGVLFASIPLSVGVAILRYRLWDIDTIINKALVYGLLTGILGALYAGLILGLASQISAQPVVIVISTLLIAALVQPLRRWLQNSIDRRFYRKKYDAAKTLAAFSAALRQEVDLNDLREHLLAVVTETMQPAHASLWLRQPEQPPAEQTHLKEANVS